MSWLLDCLLGQRIARETDRQVRELVEAPLKASSEQTQKLLASLRANGGAKIRLGETLDGAPVEAAADEIIRAYGLVTGGTGSGKSMFALGIIDDMIRATVSGGKLGFAVLDAKGDLFLGALWLLQRQVEELAAQDAKAARALRRRIVICDFSGRDPVSSYNILARWPGAESDYFAWSRADLLLDLLPGTDRLSLSGTAVLQKLLLLLSEFDLPFTHLDQALSDELFRNRLVLATKSSALRAWFSRQFPNTPKSTLASLRRRAEALLSSEGVRLALSGTTAPDFRRLQDEGRIILVNCFGPTIARSVRRLLQALVLSDVRQAVFARQNRAQPFLWICDEAQNFFLTEKLRDNMADLLTMSRSFGSFFLYLTQNMTTAVQDARMLKILHTNTRWSYSMRGDPADCAFLKPALPITGRMAKPRTGPFEEARFYSPEEERSLVLDGVSRLPDRVGWLWFKALASEALKVRTRELAMPSGPDLEVAVSGWRNDPGIGMRVARQQYEQAIAERDKRWIEAPPATSFESLKDAYRREREGAP